MTNRTQSKRGEFKKFINGFRRTFLKTHQVSKEGAHGRKIVKKDLKQEECSKLYASCVKDNKLSQLYLRNLTQDRSIHVH